MLTEQHVAPLIAMTEAMDFFIATCPLFYTKLVPIFEAGDFANRSAREGSP
jgi:hypothetical protein